MNRKPIHVDLNVVGSLTNTYYSKPTVVNMSKKRKKTESGGTELLQGHLRHPDDKESTLFNF